MSTDHRELLKNIRTFPSLIKYLRDELDWPISSDDFEELTYDYTPEELGIDSKNAAKIQEIKRLRPLSVNQPWGIFFVKFEPKRLPVAALRRILSRVVVKKRASANSAERVAWQVDDLLFVSNYGEGEERRINLAHFTHDQQSNLPTLKVLGWDNLDTPLHLDHVADVLNEKLAWPEDEGEVDVWRETWRSAFTLRHREVITTSKALAIKLAELARGIRNRINAVLSIETEDGSVTKLMKAFQEALIHDLDEDGFADMYAQTIAYGLLSARIANPGGDTTDDIATQLPVTNPFLKELMETFLDVGGQRGQAGGSDIDFDELGVSEVVELLDDANMEAVLRDFGDRSPQDDPVIHFYELFLKEYDAKKRMRRGVFYTPRPVVSYIVRSVDELLRTEFDLTDGLADTTTWGEMAERQEGLEIPDGIMPDQVFVLILDPATGTGTFLVEVIDLIHKTMVKKWTAEDHGDQKINKLWNEYVPDHLLPRLHGFELLMAPYAIAHLKIGLKLYETGYRFDSDERARVYLTNSLEPSGEGQMRLDFLPALAHEAQAVNEIKRKQRFTVVIGNPPYSRSSSNKGDYAKELIAPYKNLVREEKNIQPLSDDYIKFIGLAQHLLSQSHYSVFGMITNNTFLSGRLHRGMRQILLRDNAQIKIINLHGSQKVRYLGASGATDQNVFDILQGVSISLTARGSFHEPTYEYAELVGTREEKYEALLEGRLRFGEIDPLEPFFLLVPVAIGGSEYQSWPSLTEIIQFQCVSGKPGDDNLLVAFDMDEVIPKLQEFRRELESSGGSGYRLTEAGRNFVKLSPDHFDPKRIIPYAYRPFDIRYTYYDSRIWTRPLEQLMACIDGSPVLLTTKLVKDAEFAHVFVTRLFTDVIFLSNTSSVNCYSFPRRHPQDENGLRFSQKMSNFNGIVISPSPDKSITDDEVLNYVYAVLHSPNYRAKYLGFLRLDFPRVPTTHSLKLFSELTRLGGELVAYHLMESPKINDIFTTYNGPKNPAVGKVGWSDGTVWLDAGKTIAREGHRATEYGTIGFHDVPEEIWDFYIGGYQVCHKWLKDRKGRKLTRDDLNHYQQIVVALNETFRIMQEIDDVIEEHGGWPDAFSVSDEQL